MTTTKTWILYTNTFIDADYIWITGLGCDLAISEPRTEEIILPSGTRSRFTSAGLEISIKSYNEKQESMLLLKYGNNLGLRYVLKN